MMRGLCALLLLCSACSTATELMLVVKAGSGLTIGAGADIDTLRIRAQPASADTASAFYYSKDVTLCTTPGEVACRPERYAQADYDGGLSLPVHLLFEPGSDDISGDVRIWVDGLKSGTPRLSSGILAHFSNHHRLWLELPLYPQCLDKLDCQAADKACDASLVCVDVMPTTSASDGGDVVPSDAGVLGSVTDATIPVDFASTDLSDCGAEDHACCTAQGATPCASPDLVCNPGDSVCKPCGKPDGPCCTGLDELPCNSDSLTCVGSLCRACGQPGEPCCDGGLCVVGACTASAGMSVCE